MPPSVTIKLHNTVTQETQEYRVRSGLGLQAVCAREDTPIEFDCRRADCGICIVKVVKGLEKLSAPTRAEQDFLQAMKATEHERLACQTRVLGDVELEIEDYSVPGL